MNQESELNVIKDSIKKMLGLSSDYEAFDSDIILFINSAIMQLSQLGVCSPDFKIVTGSETWNDLLGEYEDNGLLNGAISYIYIKVRLLFDPPTSGYVTSAFQKELDELTWRLRIQVDGGKEEKADD